MSVTPGRPRDPEVDRRIAQAALDLFADAGWAGFAMEVVARRAGVGKASLYLRWSTKEALLTDAVTWRLARVADVDTGTLRGDLVELATQILDIYAGDTSRVALRLGLEAAAIPGVAEHYEAMRRAQALAARAIVRRGIRRGEVAPDTSATLLLDTLTGGAMMHALITPADRRDALARNTGAYVTRLVDFLLRAVTPALPFPVSGPPTGRKRAPAAAGHSPPETRRSSHQPRPRSPAAAEMAPLQLRPLSRPPFHRVPGRNSSS